MQSLGSVIVLVGMAVAFLAQIVGAGVAFRLSFINGLLSLVVPGYLLFTLKHSGAYWKIVGPWMAGLLGMVFGLLLLS